MHIVSLRKHCYPSLKYLPSSKYTGTMLKYKLETTLYKSCQETTMNEMKYLLVEKGIFHETKRDQTMEEACKEDIQEQMAT